MKIKRRKQELIDREVQGALARRLVLQWAMFIGVTFLLTMTLRWMDNPFANPVETLQGAWWTYGPLWLVLLCLAPVFVFDAIKLSNRFAGPVYRIRQATKALADGGEPRHVQFRGSDFWKDLASDFNRVVDRVAESEAKAKADS